MTKQYLSYVSVFLLGIACTLMLVVAISDLSSANGGEQSPLTGDTVAIDNQQPFADRNRPSPQNYLKDSQIKVYKDRVLINAENVKWAEFTDTKSMLPVINKDSNALQVEPVCPEEIEVGDIVSYRSEYAPGIIIHRVVYKGNDLDGSYFILKGDNNPTSDPGKIRCPQIERKVIGVLY